MSATPPTDPFQRHQLGNGLQVVLYRDTTLPLVTVNLWYRVGSKNERPGKTGFAHLFEHMLFQGSENVRDTDHFRYIQQVGGVANGSTWYDRTNYYETLPSSHLELGLWLESDRMGFLLPAMTSEKLENQRAVVMNERRERVDNQPYGRASERIHELLYPSEHPYHWPVIGYMEDIEAATLDDVCSFFRTYYVPNNAVLTIAGEIEFRDALALVERYFGDIPPGQPPPAPRPNPPLARTDRGAEVLEDQVTLPRTYRAYCLPGYGDDEWYAASLLSMMIGDGKACPLHHRLVYEQQIAHDVGCYVLPTESGATFAVVASGQPDTSLARLDQSLDEALDSLLDGDLDGSDRDRALNSLVTAHHHELQSLDHRADSISMATTLFDQPEWVWSEPERYRAIRLGAVIDCARKYCQPEMAVRLGVVPAGSTGRL